MYHKPPGSSCNSSHTHIDSNNEITEEEPATNERVLGRAGRLLHDVDIWGVEPQSSGRQSISNQVHPEQLNRDQSLRETQDGCQENAGNHKEDG